MTASESKCVAMKRRGAEFVAKQLAGKSVQEKLEYWRMRTEELVAKRAEAIRSSRTT